ncbi:hypothetical protein ALC56_12414, partial [Trachymyrmex septentrionalis]
DIDYRMAERGTWLIHFASESSDNVLVAISDHICMINTSDVHAWRTNFTEPVTVIRNS